MTAHGGGHRGDAVPLGRVAAVIGAACVVLHVATAVPGGHGGIVRGAVLVAMAVACLPCVRGLWRDPGVAVWRTTGLMYGGMLFVHLLLLSAGTGASGHAGHPAGGAGTADGAAWVETGMWGGLLLAGVQAALSGFVLATGRAGAGRLPAPAG